LVIVNFRCFPADEEIAANADLWVQTKKHLDNFVALHLRRFNESCSAKIYSVMTINELRRKLAWETKTVN
jgi:hypothetical protein